MTSLVTGGAGFIGRWLVSRLLAEGEDVVVLDDLSNGRRENLRDLEAHARFRGLVVGDLKDPAVLGPLFSSQVWDHVYHLGASIHVQGSIDDPGTTFRNDALGTLEVLDACRAQFFARNGVDPAQRPFLLDEAAPRLTDRRPRVTVMSTCMVYAVAAAEGGIDEEHPLRPASPYAAAKIAADSLALSYHSSYGLPVVVARPFNTYGPFQKANSEGGVVSIFLKRDIDGMPPLVKGDGTQTRDLLYVEDCADFLWRAGRARGAEGLVINAGTGRDVAIRDLAALCTTDGNHVEYVPHDHPQAEIPRLRCDGSRARHLLGWEPRVPLEEGLRRTRRWLQDNRWAW